MAEPTWRSGTARREARYQPIGQGISSCFLRRRWRRAVEDGGPDALYASSVTEGGQTLTSLSGTGLSADQQAELCSPGGASFSGNLAGSHNISVDID